MTTPFTLDELLWLEDKLRHHGSARAKPILTKVREQLRAEAKKRNEQRKEKLSPDEREAIETYLLTNPVNVIAPPPKVDLSGKTGLEVLAALGLTLPQEEASV